MAKLYTGGEMIAQEANVTLSFEEIRIEWNQGYCLIERKINKMADIHWCQDGMMYLDYHLICSDLEDIEKIKAFCDEPKYCSQKIGGYDDFKRILKNKRRMLDDEEIYEFINSFGLNQKYGINYEDVKFELYRFEAERMCEKETDIWKENRNSQVSTSRSMDAYEQGVREGKRRATEEYMVILEETKNTYMDIWATKKIEMDKKRGEFDSLNEIYKRLEDEYLGIRDEYDIRIKNVVKTISDNTGCSEYEVETKLKIADTNLVSSNLTYGIRAYSNVLTEEKPILSCIIDFILSGIDLHQQRQRKKGEIDGYQDIVDIYARKLDKMREYFGGIITKIEGNDEKLDLLMQRATSEILEKVNETNYLKMKIMSMNVIDV